MQVPARRQLVRTIVLFVAVCGTSAGAAPKQIRFTVDTARDVKPISPYIYGTNAHDPASAGRPANRLGGNRWTAYNWENNASNAGADWHHQSDGYLSGSDMPGAPVRVALEAAERHGQALIVTVPMAGYVAADRTPEGDVNRTPDYLNVRFHRSLPTRSGPLALEPDAKDKFVYQDEFVNWVERDARVDARQVIFYALDNEPDLWSHTHARIHPQKVTDAEMVQRTTEWATAIKRVKADALVFGAVNYGWNGFRTLQDAPDANGRDFHQFFLAEMNKAGHRAGRRLLDVLDVHWYPEARGGTGAGVRVIENDTSPAVAAARVQAPRSLWDPTYVETSWITRETTKGRPIALIARLRTDVETFYPGTRIAITEYNFGAAGHVSGGIAHADALGIFGREGVFAANWWRLDDGGQGYVNAAFDLYLNYDGRGARFGDRSVFASTDDFETTSIHASTHDADASRVTLVLINRSDDEVQAEVKIAHSEKLATADAYRFTSERAAIEHVGEIKLPEANTLTCTLPRMSATVVRVSK